MATILLVDGDSLQALLRKSILERRFPDVQRVNGAAEALCLVEQRQFSTGLGLVICSSRMTGIDGPAFVAELRARLPWLPVLVLGSEGKTSSDFADKQVRFLPLEIATEGMLAAASQMLAQPELKTA
jgi:DNA-binding NtrC family response regulator